MARKGRNRNLVGKVMVNYITKERSKDMNNPGSFNTERR